MPAILLGPLLRFVDATRATVWVEVDAPGRVDVHVELPGGGTRTGSSTTLSLHGHHFALVTVPDLPTGYRMPYTVDVDEQPAWPPTGPDWAWPPSEIRTPDDSTPLRLSFGSCRRAGDDGPESTALVGVDALSALAHRMRAEHGAEDRWPDLLLFVGDQVYADDPTPRIVEKLTTRHTGRDEGEEGTEADVRGEIGDFEEYTWLYHETWGPDPVRWLLSTVPTCMLLDDHDLRDDWNTSQVWREEMAAQPWWRDRVMGAFASYWVYQHLGNLSPEQLAADALHAALRLADSDAERDALVDTFARDADADASTARWSFSRDIGDTRLLAIDSRCARQLAPGERRIADPAEWAWVREAALGEDRPEPAQHLLLATTLPAFLLHGIHHAETFDEAVADGAWGRWAAGMAEKLRQAADLEHWAAFHHSFRDLVDLLRDVGGGDRQAPASVLVLSGDVHCSYTAQVRVPGVDPDRTTIHQLVMSPFRNPLQRSMKVANRILDSRPVRAVTRGLALAAGVRETDVAWEVENGPWFDNGVMTVVLHASGRVHVEADHARVVAGSPHLRRTLTRDLRGPVDAGSRVTSA